MLFAEAFPQRLACQGYIFSGICVLGFRGIIRSRRMDLLSFNACC